MTLKEAYEKQRREKLSLQHQVAKLQKDLDKASEGLYTPDEKVAFLKKINHLSHELKSAEKERDRYRALWDKERNRNMYDDFSKHELQEENEALKKEIAALRKENDSKDKEISRLTEDSNESSAKIDALSDKICHLQAKLNNDSSNSGIPTSKTPIDKNKIIPNSREKSSKPKGGQPGHKKHTLAAIPEEDVTETEDHFMDAACPHCGGELEEIGFDEKDELDYEVRIIKRRHRFHKYHCTDCGKELRTSIPLRLKEKCQYGPYLQAMILSFLDLGFVSTNRTKKLLTGFFSGQLNPCEAYIIGMQKKAGKRLTAFNESVKSKLTTESIVYWDDTVASINKTRGCIRFYGTENLALYTAHSAKDRAGIDEDGVLASLGKNIYVMHDHVTMNYNPDFVFINIECNQHLQRDLQKLAETSGHEWASEFKTLISTTIHDRNQKMRAGKDAFSSEYVQGFNAKIDKLLEKGDKAYAEDQCRYYSDDERRLLARIKKYRKNYFMWVTDFRLPTTNNLSERSLRFTKIHEKVSGQFESVEYAKLFASIRTYIETCARNGINEFEALLRLMQDNPFTLSEVLSYSGNQ